MATNFGTFTEDAPAQTTGTFDAHPVNPDIQNQDSHSYAGAVAQQKVMDLAAAAPGAPPTVEKMWDFYDKAYSDAEAFKKSQTEANLALARQQQQKVWELTPQKGDLSPIQVEAAQRAQIEQQKQQWAEGPSAVAAASNQPGGLKGGEIKAEQPAEGDKISASALDLNGIQRLYALHDQMTATAPLETGGTFRSWLGHSREAAINTNSDAKNYFAAADLLQTSFGKGIQGDLPAATTKQNIVEMMQQGIIPNEMDNSASAHGKFFNLYNQGYQMLTNLRAQMNTEGHDTTRIDKALADYGPWLQQHKNEDPVRATPIVQVGTSPQTNQIVNNAVNAAIGAQTQGQPGQVRQIAAPATTVSATLPSQTSPGATLIGTTSEAQSSTIPGFMPTAQQPTGPTAPPAIPGPVPQNAPRLGQLGSAWGMP